MNFKYCLVLCISFTVCGCHSITPKPSRSHSSTDTVSRAIRDNSYSLLYELLNEEKNVSKLLIIKRDSRELNRLIKDISTASDKAASQLKLFSEQDQSLRLDAINLPPGEDATRKAIAGTKKKELFGNSGDAFERALLLTQIQAVNYAAHLALVAADNDTNTSRSAWLKSLSQEMKELYSQSVGLLSRAPHVP